MAQDLNGRGTRPLKIAYTFDRKSDNLSKGLSYEECCIYETDENIEIVAETMRRLGHEVELVGNLEAVVKRLASDPLPDWDLVFNYAEGTTGSAAMREARMPALLEAYGYTCVLADSLGMVQGNHKILTKMILDYHRIPNSPYAIVPSLESGSTNETSPAHSAINSSPYAHALQTYPLFVKPSCDTYSRGITSISKVLSPTDLEPAVASLRQQYPDQEVLIEPFLSGREITYTIIGTGPDARVIGGREVGWPKGNQWED
ncbi:hypothetical protein FS837_003803 [Tulasnella sp. UAMH 9824]|nr:hypothetical protein FS837_003803 [Tulasnella sp. UAMH 9824]